jgi:hypothetical protein
MSDNDQRHTWDEVAAGIDGLLTALRRQKIGERAMLESFIRFLRRCHNLTPDEIYNTLDATASYYEKVLTISDTDEFAELLKHWDDAEGEDNGEPDS